MISQSGDSSVINMEIRWGLRSITGDYRENNEDRGFADPQGRYFIVCDGMGGQAAGEKASEMAVTLVSAFLDKQLDFEHDAGEKVRKKIDRKSTRLNSSHMSISYAVFC